MTKHTRDYVEKETKALLDISYVCPEAKGICRKWLKEEGGENEKEASIALIKELKEDVEPVGDLLAFAHFDNCVKCLREKEAKEILTHAEELKADGINYCDCPVCVAAKNIIEKEKDIIE